MVKVVMTCLFAFSVVYNTWGRNIETIVDSLCKNLYIDYPVQEKVYLHMDNRSYYIGDTIWFKAYVMNATILHPTQLSGVLYVELLNEKGVEMEHKKLRMENGMCHGEFVLKDDYRTGYYEIRAYTRYMLNWGNSLSNSQDIYYKQMNVLERDNVKHRYKRMEKSEDFIPGYNHCMFSRVFPVYSSPKQAGHYERKMDFYPYHSLLAYPKETNEEFRVNDLILSFYPEGGNLVANIENNIAFEAVDQWGRKCEVEGFVTQGKDCNVIASIKSNERGRGMFTICPINKITYTAHIQYKNEKYRFQLPEAIESGVAIQLSAPVADDDVAMLLRATSDRVSELIGMSVQCRGVTLFFDTLTIVDDSIYVKIPHNKLRTGVNQISLFNVHGEILADRLFFVSPSKKQAVLIVDGLPDSVKPYESIRLDLQTQDGGGWPIQALYSLSITDADERDSSFDTRDIRSEMLLSSDLKGFIEDVDSYFHHDNDTVMADDIDLLMLVQGWRRYEWKPIRTIKYVPEKGLQLDGYVISDFIADKSVRDPHNYMRIPNRRMEVSINSPMITFYDTCVVDSLGEFQLDINRYFVGEAPMTLVVKGDKKNKKERWYQRILSSDINTPNAYPVIHRVFSPLPDVYGYYQNHTPNDIFDMENAIEEVIIKKRFKKEHQIFYEYPDMVVSYFKEWNHVIDRGCPLMNYYGGYNEDNTVLLSYHLGRMRLSQNENKLREYDSIYIRYAPRYYKPYHMPDTIKVYTNLCTREQLEVKDLDPETDHRDLLRCVFSYLKRSESPRRAPYMLKDGVRHTYFEGYSRVANFYNPDYSECALPDTADYRRTLYWNPDVWTDHQGRASVSFYNNRKTKHLHIRAEGFTRYGEFIVYDSNKQ